MAQHKTAFVNRTHIADAEAWGAVTIWLPEHGPVSEFIASLQPGDIVGVWSCEDLAPETGRRNGESRHQTFRKSADALIAAGVELHELQSGRTSTSSADLVAMMLDAVDRIYGLSKVPRGRPNKAPFTDDEKRQIASAWFNRKLRNNRDRVAAVQQFVPRFMLHDFYDMRDELEAL